MLDAYIEAQVLCFYGFWFLEAEEVEMCVKFQLLIHILKPKGLIFMVCELLDV